MDDAWIPALSALAGAFGSQVLSHVFTSRNTASQRENEQLERTRLERREIYLRILRWTTTVMEDVPHVDSGPEALKEAKKLADKRDLELLHLVDEMYVADVANEVIRSTLELKGTIPIGAKAAIKALRALKANSAANEDDWRAAVSEAFRQAMMPARIRMLHLMKNDLRSPAAFD